MAKYFLIVKGSLSAAITAANANLPGVAHEGGVEHATDTRLDVWFPGITDDKAASLLNTWFCKETTLIMGYGYPEGTLLVWGAMQ